MAYSMDLRRRVVVAVEAGQAIAAVARRFSVSRPTVRDWRDRARRGALSAGTPGPKGPTKFTQADEQRIRQRVATEPGVTGGQLLEELSVTVSSQTVYRQLKRLGLSLKKVADRRRAGPARRGPATRRFYDLPAVCGPGSAGLPR